MVDEMNAEAIKLLEERAKVQQKQRNKEKVAEVFDRFKFGGHSSTNPPPRPSKYRLPYIEDLVNTKSNDKRDTHQ